MPNLSSVIASEVSPARLRYELPKLGIAGSNPALRINLTNVNIVLEDDLRDRNLILTKALQKLTTYAMFDRRFASLQEGSLFGNFLHCTAGETIFIQMC